LNVKLLARDAFVRTNRLAIAMMFVRLSVCLGRACIVIIGCMLARILVYGWIVWCSGHPVLTPKRVQYPPIPSRLCQFHLEERNTCTKYCNCKEFCNNLL